MKQPSSKTSKFIGQVLKRLRNDFQLSIIVALTIFTLLTITPFLFYRIFRAEWIIVALDLAMLMFTVGVAVYAWVSKNTPRAAMSLVTFIALGMVLTAFFNPKVAPFWLYCMTLFAFSLVPPKAAILLSLFGFSAVVMQTESFADAAQRASYIATMVATILFAFIFAKRSEYQRAMLAQMARTDALTMTHNRRAFDEAASLIDSQHLNKEQHTAVAIFDIDNFKAINDDFGHEKGDQVLVRLVDTIKQHIRIQDSLYRIGGEEFCLIMTDIDQASAYQVLDRLREVVEQTKLLSERPVTISIGLAELKEGETVESTSKIADEALYRAKNEGRNRVVLAA